VDLMLVLIAVTAFPVACLAFVLWMGVIEDSLPAGVRRAVREADPPPILAVPVRRTTVEPAGWWESVAAESPALDDATAARDVIPEQRTPPAAPAPTPAEPVLPTPALPATEPLAGT